MQENCCKRWKPGRAWQSSHITLLLRSAPLSNLPLEILDGLKLQKSSVPLRKLSTSESKAGQITNPQKQILSISIPIQLKPSVTTLVSEPQRWDFCLLFIAHSTPYQHLLPHEVLGKFQRTGTEQMFPYFRRMKEVTPKEIQANVMSALTTARKSGAWRS